MASVHYDKKLILTMSPKELRDLAGKMEKRWPELKAGQTTFVDILHFARDDRDTMVVLHLDQMYFHDLARAGEPVKKVFIVYEDINHADVALVSCHETQGGADAECQRLRAARPRDNFSVHEQELKP